MRPTRPTVRGIAASCAAVLVAFLVAVSWPGAAAQARSSSHSPSAAVSAGEASGASSREAATVVDTADDHDIATAADPTPVVVSALVALGLGLLGLAARPRGQWVDGALGISAQGRAPPAFA